jgi:SsrA-binding protein
MTTEDPHHRILARNRKAHHEYLLSDVIEAGIVLGGTEVKAMRAGKVQLKDGFVEFRDGEAWLTSVHVSHYSHGNRENHEPEQPRKLLLKKREIDRLSGRIQTKGFTVIPLSVYLKGNRIKVEIALARGKKLYDKRQAERERELDREARQAMKTAIADQ